MKKITLLIFSVLWLVGLGYGQTKKYSFKHPDGKIEEITGNTKLAELFYKDYTVKKLKNGLQYYYLKNEIPSDSLCIQFLVRGNRFDEKENELGYFHILRSIAVETSISMTNLEVKKFLDSINFDTNEGKSSHVNFSGTNYNFKISNNIETIDKTFAFIAGIGANIRFDKLIVDNKKFATLESIDKLKSNEVYLLQKEIFETINYKSPYKEAIFPDPDKLLKEISAENLLKFYKNWYRPESQKIIIVGDVEEELVDKMMNKYCANQTNPKNIIKFKTIDNIDHHEPFVKVMGSKFFGEDVGFQYNSKIKTDKIETFEQFIENIHLLVISEMIKNRINNFSIQKESPFKYVAGGSLNPLEGNVINLQSIITLKGTKDFPKGIEEYRTQVEKIKLFGFTQEEFDAVLNIVRQRVEGRLESNQKDSNELLAGWIKSISQNILVPLHPISEKYLFDEYYSTKVTIEDINDYVKKKFSKISEVVIAFGGAGMVLPPEDALKNMVTRSLENITEHVDNIMLRPFIKNFIKYGSIKSEKKYKDDITELILNNGVRVVIKPTPYPPLDPSKIIDASEPRDKIFMHAVSNHGSGSLQSLDDLASIVLIPQTIAASGLGDFTVEQLSRKLKNANIYIQPSITEDSSKIIASTRVEHLKNMMEITYLYFTSPRVDKKNWDNIIKRTKGMYAQRHIFDSTTEFRDKIESVNTKNNPRRKPINPSIYDNIDSQKALSIFKKIFENAADFTFYIAGDFKIDDIKQTIVNYIGALPTNPSNLSPKTTTTKLEFPKGYKLHKMVAGNLKNTLIAHSYNAPMKYNIDNLILLNTISSLLEKRLEYRFDFVEKVKGLIPNVKYNFYEAPNNYVNIMISYACTATLSKKLMTAVKDEVKNFKKNIDISEFDYFKNNYEGSNKLDPKDAEQWIGRMIFMENRGLTLNNLDKYDNLNTEKINLKTIKQATKVLLGNDLQEFVLEHDQKKDIDMEKIKEQIKLAQEKKGKE